MFRRIQGSKGSRIQVKHKRNFRIKGVNHLGRVPLGPLNPGPLEPFSKGKNE